MKCRVLLLKKGISDYNFFFKWMCIGKLELVINFFVFMCFLFKLCGKYDVVYIFSVWDEYLFVFCMLKCMIDKIFVFFFGLDINLRNFIKNNFICLYRYMDLGIVENENFKMVVLKIIGLLGLGDKILVFFFF